jgi:UDP-glucose 4-epimerase
MDGARVLVTGGTGYIGSHTVLSLLDAGASVVIVDNLCNSSAASLDRVKELAGDKASRIVFEQVRCLRACGLQVDGWRAGAA